MPSLLDDEAVTPDDDGVWDAGVDWFERPEDRRWTLTPPPWWSPHEEPLDAHLLRIGAAPLLVRT